jgi:wobble nucleotide-excising tRNase
MVSNSPDDPTFRERMAESPDKWTLAWWNKQFTEVITAYRGASHGINLALARTDEFQNAVAALRKRCDELERERDSDRAKIGELTARVQRMAEFLNDSRKKSGSKEPNL